MNAVAVSASIPAADAASTKPVLLMCTPTLYDVDYVINPWMAGNVHGASRERAHLQWSALYESVSRIAEVQLITPEPGSPDMVFTANAGLERGGSVVLSRFRHAERQGEEAHFARWFRAAGYEVLELPRDMFFEGEGDALFSHDGATLWVGYGPRTSEQSHARLQAIWPAAEVVSLHLVDPRFYHLDTCFALLGEGHVLYYPGAFDAASLARIEARHPAAMRIEVEEEDAVRFACNAVNVDRTIVMNGVSVRLGRLLQAEAFTPVQVDLSEFLKAGGAAKCLVMKLGTNR